MIWCSTCIRVCTYSISKQQERDLLRYTGDLIYDSYPHRKREELYNYSMQEECLRFLKLTLYIFLLFLVEVSRVQWEFILTIKRSTYGQMLINITL